MSNLHLALAQLEQAEEMAKESIQFGEHLTALESNKDFQALIDKLEKESSNMVKGLAYQQSREGASATLGGISRFYALISDWKREANEGVRFLEQLPEQRQEIIDEHNQSDSE